MQGNSSLEKGLLVLKAVASSREPLGIREIARRLEQKPSSIQRILHTLCTLNFVDQGESDRKYHPGHEILSLARSLLEQDELLEIATAELSALARGSDFNGFLGARRGSKAFYLAAVQSSGPLVIRATPGESMFLHSTALGKALLIDCTTDEIHALAAAEPFIRKTPRTITEPDKLIDQLRRARNVGYTTALNENLPGIFSVGAPIRNAKGAIVAAISVAFPRAAQPTLAVAAVGEKVMAVASAIEMARGVARASGMEQSDVA
jgi:DNA-binding IclR family transcriptional regulator